MYLTPEQQAILDGVKGETMAKVMKTLVMYGETFGADKMVPVSSKYNHLVTSFGLKMMGPVFDLMQQLIDAGAVSGQQFSVDPRPVDKNALPISCRTLSSICSCTPSRSPMRSSLKHWAS